MYISSEFRIDDIRYNITDISRAQQLFDFKPSYTFEEGMGEFTAWVKGQEGNIFEKSNDRLELSLEEMKATGMLAQVEG